MIRVGIYEAKTQLSRLVRHAQEGEEVVIERAGTPVAQLVALAPQSAVAASYGVWAGKVEIADDFDELPPDIAQAFGIIE